MSNHKQKAAQFLITAFGVVVLTISASTSFGFFFNFFDALIPHELLTAQAPSLAEHQARRIAARFSRHEQARYADGDRADGAGQRQPAPSNPARAATTVTEGSSPTVPFENGREA